MPLFQRGTLDSESEKDYLPLHSKYINSLLRRKISHNPTFGVYQDDTDGSFKIGMSSFKYNDKQLVFSWEKLQGNASFGGITSQVQT